jgi:hypothetical protein
MVLPLESLGPRMNHNRSAMPVAIGKSRRVKKQVSTNQPETRTNATIIAVGYRARCTMPRCKNLGRMILRYADPGGRPISNSAFCTVNSDYAASLGPAEYSTLAKEHGFDLRVVDDDFDDFSV